MREATTRRAATYRPVAPRATNTNPGVSTHRFVPATTIVSDDSTSPPSGYTFDQSRGAGPVSAMSPIRPSRYHAAAAVRRYHRASNPLGGNARANTPAHA